MLSLVPIQVIRRRSRPAWPAEARFASAPPPASQPPRSPLIELDWVGPRKGPVRPATIWAFDADAEALGADAEAAAFGLRLAPPPSAATPFPAPTPGPRKDGYDLWAASPWDRVLATVASIRAQYQYQW
jgi:hypothetical protein